ncbi:MAG TPA: YggS family pyridoxal phosphate-dependent enzyme [Rhodobacteraceae bacterium]|jgi:pyridoxal phosphate enzyme (YggS family)|nr:YggS family pyridoxal phosphate-dependent enzyme [Paracoccaceae bacterium]HBG98411.1 YggS family pyridoxal phosphate-dependent enzyme [Paracoccaceae bacterium]
MGLQRIQDRVGVAARAAGRAPGDIALIAVSKLQPESRIAAVLDQGHRLFGENRVQEAAGRWPALMARYPDTRVDLLGPLQSNKVRQAMGLFAAIHSLDRPKLARRIADIAQETGACPDLFIQVNTGEEPQKAGVLPEDADAFVAGVRAMDLPLVGLMCIPPVAEEPALHFALLAAIAKRNGLAGLSMGMSADFETAIAFGATHIRVGSAIFGDRPPAARSDASDSRSAG